MFNFVEISQNILNSHNKRREEYKEKQKRISEGYDKWYSFFETSLKPFSCLKPIYVHPHKFTHFRVEGSKRISIYYERPNCVYVEINWDKRLYFKWREKDQIKLINLIVESIFTDEDLKRFIEINNKTEQFIESF